MCSRCRFNGEVTTDVGKQGGSGGGVWVGVGACARARERVERTVCTEKESFLRLWDLGVIIA